MLFESFETLRKRKTYLQPRKFIESSGNHYLTTKLELYLQTTLHLRSKNFRPLLTTLKLTGVCFEQQPLRPLLNVADVSVLKGRRVARKKSLGGNKKLKKLFVRKNWPARPGSQISHHFTFVRTTLKHVRQQPQKLNCLRKDLGRNFGERFDDDLKMANEVFWQIVRRLLGKRSQTAFFIEDWNGVLTVFLKDQNAILNKWKEYFSDLVN